MTDSRLYPADRRGRDRFVVERRPSRPIHDPWRHQGVLAEPEPTDAGGLVEAATIFLTGRECPWRCVMCDLWRHTIEADTPPGAIPHQIAAAVAELTAGSRPLPPHVKLYNAGSFFDARAVPPGDDRAIVAALAGFSRVIVESHPALVGARAWRFADALTATRADLRLEVAMGLETAHPDALERLHKRVTLEQFRAAASALHAHGVALRVFLLVGPPFIAPEAQDTWLRRSVDVAFDCGATVVSLIATRGGNGAMEALGRHGGFTAPSLADLERAHALALQRARGRVFADLWDVEATSRCRDCFARRRARLHRMNLEQRLLPSVTCQACGSVSAA